MNPATIATKVTLVGRRLSSLYVGRAFGSDVVMPYTYSQQKQPGIFLPQSRHQNVVIAVAEQRRTKSSMAVEFEHHRMSEENEPTKVKTMIAKATYDQSVQEPFPSIVIGSERSIEPQGSFAEAQAQVSYRKL